jgi:hypothetical protein
MSKEEEIQQLTEHFRALGAFDPEGWARSQIEEGIPQYARCVFLRGAWNGVVADGDTSWIDSRIQAAERRPRGPGAGIGPALKRMLACGASREDIGEVVRVMQWSLLSHMAYQLADSSGVDYPSAQTPRVHWRLYEEDEEGRPLRPFDVHESVLDTDPTDREMRPKGVTRAG